MADSNGRNVMVQGRIVWIAGDLFKGQVKTIFGTQTPQLDQQGQPVKQYGFGLAVPKAQVGEIWQAMHEEAYSLFPSRQIPSTFAMKFKDGDGVDHNGVPFSQREGYAGHLVFACTTQIPIKFFKFENGANILINEGIKCGDYVNVQLNVKAHTATGQGKSGLYLNPNAVQFLGYGKEIVNMPSGDTIFGNQAPPLPPGASMQPVAPQGGQMLVPPPAAPAYGAAPAAPQVAPPPNYGVIPPAHQPQAPVAPPVQQQPVNYAPQGTVPTYAPNAYVPQGQPVPQYQAPAAPQAPAMPGMPPMPGYGVPPGYPQQ